ncbi:class I SAM-dependent methyltransferase [Sodalis sp. RH15]|uniref:class I SAM-dependent methyltransferase n=1 Tax=Sodalis sp. RH15 TaxID=3394330 RepID=UPI0039B6B298
MPETFDQTTFDRYAELYEEAAHWPYRKDLELPALEACLGDITRLKILDFGCGPGFYSRLLKTKGAADVTGYDISEGMLNYARRREEKEQSGITYTSSLEASHKAEFDIVLAIYVFPYAPDAPTLFSMCQAMFDVLKPGGRLITQPIHPQFHPDAEYYRPYGFRLIEQQPRRDGSKVQLHICHPPYDERIDAYYWSQDTLNETLTRSGFKDIAWRPLHIPSRITRKQEINFLLPYARQPHAALIECKKGDSPPID